MVDFYVMRIMMGKKKFKDVPATWKEGVRVKLESEGYFIDHPEELEEVA